MNKFHVIIILEKALFDWFRCMVMLHICVDCILHAPGPKKLMNQFTNFSEKTNYIIGIRMDKFNCAFLESLILKKMFMKFSWHFFISIFEVCFSSQTKVYVIDGLKLEIFIEKIGRF